MEELRHKLIVSCQALPNEPLHSDFIMARMAVAAKEGGASGIRANSVIDIKAIKEAVDLPVIGIIKGDYRFRCDKFQQTSRREFKSIFPESESKISSAAFDG